jgi:rod shape-determining protein MreD
VKVGAAWARFAFLLAALVTAHFALLPHVDQRLAPDLLLLALLFFAIQSRPGLGALAGFLVGLATDAVAPTAFGAAALAGTVVGYLAGWVKTFSFADNPFVNALFVFAAAWCRDAIQVLAARQLAGGALGYQLLVYSPVAALATAAASLVILALFRGWLRPAAAA